MFFNWDCLRELAHPASDRVLTEALQDAPRDDIVEQEGLRLHRSVQTARALHPLEELEDRLPGEHDCRASYRGLELVFERGREEAAGSRPDRLDQALEVRDWEPDPMRRHRINVVILCQDLIVLSIHGFDLD